MFVLGIDPGLSRCGYGVVRHDGGRAGRGAGGSVGASAGGGATAVTHGVLTTPPSDPLPQRLVALHRGLVDLVARYRPDVVVVERVFFQTNARTAMSVGQASGLALTAAADAGAEVVQYTANEVKQAVVGYGAATKQQVQRMVQAMLGLAAAPRPADAADALALALCHLARAPLASRVGAAAAVGARAGATGLGNARIAASFAGVSLAPAQRGGA